MPSEPIPAASGPWRRNALIAALVLGAIAVSLGLRLAIGDLRLAGSLTWPALPLWLALIAGLPLLMDLLVRLREGVLGADVLAGLSIVVAYVLGELLAGALVVLMLAGGQALESWAVRRASFALEALARRLPAVAHRCGETGTADVPLAAVAVGDRLEVHPHEACPVDGTVLEGHSTMNEAYLTGEPFLLPKVPGSAVLSGALNGEGMLTIRADRRAADSRYAQIMQVMRDAEQHRPRLRRLGDRIGAIYTPLAILVAAAAGLASQDPVRFLSVLVVATPCPLIIAIPVAIIGAISLAARRGIIIRDPAALERIATCRVAVFDKTGTLTYGEPQLTEIDTAPGQSREAVLGVLASLERYSRHPLAGAVLAAARAEHIPLQETREIRESPGEGLEGCVDGRRVTVTGRRQLLARVPEAPLPPGQGGLECVVCIDGAYAGTCRFRDEPRREGPAFIAHLGPRHGFRRVLLVSGDRESEVRYLADQVGIDEVRAGQSPETKLALVRELAAHDGVLFMGDGINDAPALAAATVGVAFGQGSAVTAEAASVVILDSALQRADEVLHIGDRLRRIALQSAVGGMALSLVAVGVAALGYLPPVAGALIQELIDVAAVANALRVAWVSRDLADEVTPKPALDQG